MLNISWRSGSFWLKSSMGSMGWAPCHLCGWWEYNPYIPDPFTRPVCGRCCRYLCSPDWTRCPLCRSWNWPSGLTLVCRDCARSAALRIQVLRRGLPFEPCFLIACFINLFQSVIIGLRIELGKEFNRKLFIYTDPNKNMTSSLKEV